MRRKRTPFFLVAIFAVLLASFCWSLWRQRTPADVESLLHDAHAALTAERYQEVDRLVQLALTREPNSAEALLLAGSSATAQRRAAEAVAFFSRVPHESGRPRIEALNRLAELQFVALGRASEAERSYRQSLELDPANEGANRGLARLLVTVGRHWESAPYLFQLVRQDQSTVEQLCLLGVLELVVIDLPTLEYCQHAAPDDPLPLLGLARAMINSDLTSEAAEYLWQAVARDPELVEAQIALGYILLDTVAEDDLIQWHRQLPAAANSHPETWSILGTWAFRRGRREIAIRCFLETVLQNPNHQHANNQLAVLLNASEDQDAAEQFATRTRLINDYVAIVDRLRTAADDVEQMQKAAKVTAALGRYWEARAWCRMALRLSPGLDWAEEGVETLSASLSSQTPQTLTSASPVERLDLSKWPLPDLANWRDSDGVQPGLDSTTSHVRFRDSTAQAGLKFQYFNAADSQALGKRLFQVNGGGVAALDYDSDGWTDVYFTQACEWPPEPDARQLDRLYRNLGDGTFHDVTAECQIRENSFSQGVAAGDFDNDGFVDIYVANIGQNRLFRNNGDGTFSDVTSTTTMGGSRWTSSCAVADLNGDGSPDIYDVNYLKGKGVFERVCRGPNGRREVCRPGLFEAEQDQLYINRGDGSFEERTSEAGIVVENGKGLGLVVADFEGSGKLSVFVANDEVRNFYFRNETPSAESELSFRECAFLTGLAVSAEGWGQACMGVAAGDANSDGLLDLFITNFSNDSNCLYSQQPTHVFSDETRRAGLRHSSFEMLGFGTQFLDGELDGFPDLVLTNGHVDDHRDIGQAYHMRPQYYRNRGDGRFEELAADSLGRFFAREQLGRGLARLDWNRDGLDEFAVSDLEGLARMVTNRTQEHGNFVAIRLRGTHSSRDAIGAQVTLVAGDFLRVQQLTAGDGYQASNERKLVFGLNTRDHIDRLTVRWPSGVEQTWRDVATNVELMVIEGRAEIVPLAPVEARP